MRAKPSSTDSGTVASEIFLYHPETLLTELEHSKKVRKGLEAQVGALRIERRNQVVGYCVEMAKWQS